MLYSQERQALYHTTIKAYQTNLIQLSSGNISMRVTPEHLLITPSSIPYDEIRPEDMVVINLHGQMVEGLHPPSSETPMHTIVYREMPEVNAVLHTHSLHAMAFAVVGRSIPVFSTEGLAARGPLPVAEYACPGTEAQGRAALRAMQGPPPVMGALLRNHGVLAVGPTLARAFSIASQIEIAAHTYFLALQIGTPVPLTTAQIEEIRSTYTAIRTGAQQKAVQPVSEGEDRHTQRQEQLGSSKP